ncbi:hypothetical protein JW964_25970 [candidate division KSB1 bacterium]|nr:hypothetical protein [candidate division KSB1 bacterium]
MPNISIQLPALEADHTIEILVKVNGQKTVHNYKVEIHSWSECQEIENKAECLKQIIQTHDKNWRLIQIGDATNKDIALMFKEISN